MRDLAGTRYALAQTAAHGSNSIIPPDFKRCGESGITEPVTDLSRHRFIPIYLSPICYVTDFHL
jgi:hypothetical protein